jgi:alanyl-tRNA synthetase
MCFALLLCDVVQAKAFALLSEEGIAKGVRRIVAVTAADAETAIAEGQELQQQVAAAAALPDTELDKVRVGDPGGGGRAGSSSISA